jgi:hypothetical protein
MRRNRRYRPLLETLELRLAPANVDVLSYHNDTFLTGQDLQETILNPGNVNATQFGKLFTQAVDGYVYAQPLYRANLVVGGSAHNVVFVATEHDSLYAFDADSLNLLWRRSFIDPANGITTMPSSDTGSRDIVPEIGITGAPVIDGATNTLYLVAKTKEIRAGDSNPHYVQTLYAVDITSSTGANKSTPVVIGDGTGDGFLNQTTTIQVAGNGADSTGGQIKFNAMRQHQRPSLQLLGNNVYVGWASHGDNGPYHGWVVGFNKTTLQPVHWFNTTPNARGGGIWQSEGALSTDGTFLYFATGNGFGPDQGGGPSLGFDPVNSDYGESVIKLSPPVTGTAMVVTDYFTPAEWHQLDLGDADLGSGGVMLLPDAVGSLTHTHLMVETGKTGKIYLIDRDNLGKNNPNPAGPDFNVQTVTAGPGGVWGNPAFYLESANSGLIYYHGSGADTRAFRISGAAIGPASSVYNSNQFFAFPGTQPSISANGQVNSSAIDWELQVDGYGIGQPAVLHAYAARAVAATGTLSELYSSSQTSLRDQLTGAVKFTTATVTNGHVYAGARYSFSLFGLFPSAAQAPAAPSNLAAAALSDTQISLSWANNAVAPSPATGIKIERSADGVTFSQIATVARNVSAFTDAGLAAHTPYWYRVRATNQIGDSPYSSTANAATHVSAPVLTVTNICGSQVDLSWTATANDHYDVERSTDNTNFTRINSSPIPATTTTYSDTGLARATYFYRVRAFSVNPPDSVASNVAPVGLTVLDFSAGFPANPAFLTANGSAQFAETTARLTTGDEQAGSIFFQCPHGSPEICYDVCHPLP